MLDIIKSFFSKGTEELLPPICTRPPPELIKLLMPPELQWLMTVHFVMLALRGLSVV